jgi:hypothetical protein
MDQLTELIKMAPGIMAEHPYATGGAAAVGVIALAWALNRARRG